MPETTAPIVYGVPHGLLQRFHRTGTMLVPTEISWRRADRIVRRGWATLYPFHRRWQGRLEITDAGREALNV